MAAKKKPAKADLQGYYQATYSATSSSMSKKRGSSPSASTRAASGQKNLMRFGEELPRAAAKKAAQKGARAAGVPSSYSKNRRGTR